MLHLTKHLAEVFAEDSDSEKTFYGFCEDELSDHCDQVSHFVCIHFILLCVRVRKRLFNISFEVEVSYFFLDMTD